MCDNVLCLVLCVTFKYCVWWHMYHSSLICMDQMLVCVLDWVVDMCVSIQLSDWCIFLLMWMLDWVWMEYILCGCVGWWCSCIVGVDGGFIVNCCRLDVRRNITVFVVVCIFKRYPSRYSRLLNTPGRLIIYLYLNTRAWNNISFRDF